MKATAHALLISIALSHAAYGVRVEFEMIQNALSASDLSPDGRFVVGILDLDGNGFGEGSYLLDRQSGVRTDLQNPGLSAVAVSDDGSVVVGNMLDPTGVGSNVAGRWTAATGWVSLGHLPSAGACPSRSDSYEISADGSVVVGLSFINGCDSRGFIWNQTQGMLELEGLANGVNRASVVSADGSLIGGFAQGTFERTPAIWSSDTAGQLLDPPSGDAVGEIHGIRDDGSLLLGAYIPGDEIGAPKASKWALTPTGWERQQIGAGSLLPGWEGIPLDIANDDTIVGFDILLGNRRAWIQPRGEGALQELRSFFESHGATVPPGLVLEVPQAISADGHIIVGHGFASGAWIATLIDDCDFDGDLDCDIADIDELVEAIVNQDVDPIFDLSGDGNLDLDDRDAWLTQAGALNLPSGAAYLVGDIDLDGNVNGADFIAWNANKFTATAKWSLGDLNADGFTNGGDFLLWNANKFQSADVSSVPEPAGLALLILAFAGVVRKRMS